MNIILIADKKTSRSFRLTKAHFGVFSGIVTLFLLSVLIMGSVAGYKLKSYALSEAQLDSEENIQVLEDQSKEYVSVMAARLAKLQARMMRLDTLGARLVEGAKLEAGEFDFSQEPGQGGFPKDEWSGDFVTQDQLNQMVDKLQVRISDREQQLGVLDGLISDKKLAFNKFFSGLPVKGAVTSGFGFRIHPITGRRSKHSGVDIAAKYYTPINVPASGVVKFSGNKGGYGRVVEVDHGNGIVTRYAHNSQNKVRVGEAVKKGDVIALVGSSGRSTGPHVHFEVLENGKAVNPFRYLASNSK
jgi:murein DD-endopeptidase MepM/ murein hydrolase activator NlpD